MWHQHATFFSAQAVFARCSDSYYYPGWIESLVTEAVEVAYVVRFPNGGSRRISKGDIVATIEEANQLNYKYKSLCANLANATNSNKERDAPRSSSKRSAPDDTRYIFCSAIVIFFFSHP
jgi:hypothetical protein